MGATKTTSSAAPAKPPTSATTVKNRFEEGKEDSAFAAAMAAVQAMQSGKAKTVEAKVKFAGQAYAVERAKTQGDIKKEQRLDKTKLGGGNAGLDAIVSMIGEKDKNVTSIEKSKIDWDKYTKEQKLEADFEKNRKDGFLAKKRFIDNVSELEYQQKKAGQKESRKI